MLFAHMLKNRVFHTPSVDSVENKIIKRVKLPLELIFWGDCGVGFQQNPQNRCGKLFLIKIDFLRLKHLTAKNEPKKSRKKLTDN